MAAKKSTEGVQPRLFNLQQVAAYLGVSEYMARQWSLRPIDPLPTLMLPNLKKPKFDRIAVDAWIDRRNAECA